MTDMTWPARLIVVLGGLVLGVLLALFILLVGAWLVWALVFIVKQIGTLL